MEQKEINKTIEFVNEKWGKDFKCPFCHADKFTITNSIYQLPAFNKTDVGFMNRDNTVLPVIPLACENCGYTVFINAIICGVLKGAEK